MSDELDVCPFCGAQPLLNEIAPHTHNLTIGGVKLPDHPGSWTIECPACECGMIADTKEAVTAAWNRRAQPAEEVQPVGNMVLMPRRLTAENGAKGALSGEFSERFSTDCPVCDADEPDTECDICSGSGRFIAPVPVEWDTIKRIYKAAVELLGARPPAADAEMVRKAARYDYLRMRVCGIGSKGFDFVNLPPMPPNWARGSIAQHFDEAIDAALAASKEKKE